MKTYKIKNYKGNLLESLKRFQSSHKDVRIIEAIEDNSELKIMTEEKQQIEEAYTKISNKNEVISKIQKWISQQKFTKDDLKEILKGRRNDEDDTFFDMEQDLNMLPDPRDNSDPYRKIYYEIIKKLINDTSSTSSSNQKFDDITNLLYMAIKEFLRAATHYSLEPSDTKVIRRIADKYSSEFQVHKK